MKRRVLYFQNHCGRFIVSVTPSGDPFAEADSTHEIKSVEDLTAIMRPDDFLAGDVRCEIVDAARDAVGWKIV